jgi:hypothetical protein
MSIATSDICAEQFVPAELSALADPQTAIPAIAKDGRLIGLIEEAVKRFPTAWITARWARGNRLLACFLGSHYNALWAMRVLAIGRKAVFRRLATIVAVLSSAWLLRPVSAEAG